MYEFTVFDRYLDVFDAMVQCDHLLHELCHAEYHYLYRSVCNHLNLCISISHACMRTGSRMEHHRDDQLTQ